MVVDGADDSPSSRIFKEVWTEIAPETAGASDIPLLESLYKTPPVPNYAVLQDESADRASRMFRVKQSSQSYMLQVLEWI